MFSKRKAESIQKRLEEIEVELREVTESRTKNSNTRSTVDQTYNEMFDRLKQAKDGDEKDLLLTGIEHCHARLRELNKDDEIFSAHQQTLVRERRQLLMLWNLEKSWGHPDSKEVSELAGQRDALQQHVDEKNQRLKNEYGFSVQFLRQPNSYGVFSGVRCIMEMYEPISLEKRLEKLRKEIANLEHQSEVLDERLAEQAEKVRAKQWKKRQREIDPASDDEAEMMEMVRDFIQEGDYGDSDFEDEEDE